MSFDKEKSIKAAEKYVQQGKLEAAIEEYRKVIDADPHDFTSTNTLGDLYIRTGKTDLAIEGFFRVADTYHKNGDNVKAIAMYKKILKFDSERIEASLKLAQLYSRQKLLGDARRQYQTVLDTFKRTGRTREALEVMQALTEIDPNNTEMLLEMAKGYQEAKMNKEAFTAYLQAGKELSHTRHSEEAIEAFKQALALDATSRPAFEGLVESITQTGRYGIALDMISTLLGKNPQDADLIILLGHTFQNANMLEQAESTFGYLLDFHKTIVDPMVELANRYLEGWHIERVIACLDRVLDRLLEQKKEKMATAILKEILIADPNNILALRRLIYIYMNTHDTRTLVATLKLYIQGAMTQGLKSEAIWALQQLMEHEPHEETQGQLEDLKANAAEVGDSEFVAHDPLLQTFHPLTSDVKEKAPEPVKQEVAAHVGGSSTAVLLEGMFNQNPEMLDSQMRLLEELVAEYPDYLDAHIKLKQIYLDRGLKKKAANTCLEISRLYAEQGENEKAKEFSRDAYELSLLEDAPITILPPVLSNMGEAIHKAEVETTTNHRASDIVECLNKNTYLDRVWRHEARTGRSFSLIVISVDSFKEYLDNLGQHSADICLKKVSTTLRNELKRPIDELIENGGSHFGIVLPETIAIGAEIVAQRVRTAVESLAIPHPQSRAGRNVTVSLGVVTVIPERGSTPDEIIAKAANAAFMAEKAGGNRITNG